MKLAKRLLTISIITIGLILPHLVIASSDGATIYEEACTGCHNAGSRPLDNVHLSKAQWKESVEQMASLGAEVPSGKKLEMLLDYLVIHKGPIGPATDTGKK